MSVAETPAPAMTQPYTQQHLAVVSAIGAAALLSGLGLIFAAVPTGWWLGWNSIFANSPELLENAYLADALLILVDLIVLGALVYLAYGALQAQTLPGVRAGITFLAVYTFGILWFGAWLGDVMAAQFREDPAIGWTVLAIIVGALLAGAGYLYLKVPGWAAFLEAVEHQGWFHGLPFKGNQGVRVRRGTIVGVLAVGITGIITLSHNQVFGRERPDEHGVMIANDWYWNVPYTNGDYIIPLMYKVHLLMPIVLGVILLWIAWRVVNIPAFADFLIATEAEMNKVSWTNRKRLMQDTVVVLTTVFLFTMFLFVVDIVWIKVLSAPFIQVLLIDPKAAAKEQEQSAKW